MQDSLREMELQCKERVNVLEALEESRKTSEKEARKAKREERSLRRAAERNPSSTTVASVSSGSGWIGGGTVPPVNYEDIARPAPPVPPRPSYATGPPSTESLLRPRTDTTPTYNKSPSPLPAAPTLPVPTAKPSRSPSPEHRKKAMLTTLRNSNGKPRSNARVAARKPPAASKAAGLAWDTTVPASPPQAPSQRQSRSSLELPGAGTPPRKSLDDIRPQSDDEYRRASTISMTNPGDVIPSSSWREPQVATDSLVENHIRQLNIAEGVISPGSEPPSNADNRHDREMPPPPPPHDPPMKPATKPKPPPPRLSSKPPELSYRREYPPATLKPGATSIAVNPPSILSERGSADPHRRRPVANSSTPRADRNHTSNLYTSTSSGSEENLKSPPRQPEAPRRRAVRQNSKQKQATKSTTKPTTPPSSDESAPESSAAELLEPTSQQIWEARSKAIMKDLPRGVDEAAARQILNDIVVQGDEVHWSDIAGLEIAKKALKEAVVYPFLRPDLFMGLREPARGMLLFGPPGTGKTMLARAVATESKSTFFAISASSLTSKWHGDSEKLVRALFALAKKLAPSIIFVDEIDSLLSTRSSSSEHEASRRSKTEFLIQWSDLQRAAAGRDLQRDKEGDPSRVLVLAATNVPWDIDEAARRRFVRRQYIPLPESETRAIQIRTLLSHQKHGLTEQDIEVLVRVTEGKILPFPTPPPPPLFLTPQNTKKKFLYRLLRLRHNIPRQRRRHGSPPQPRRSTPLHAHQPDPTHPLRRL